MTIERVTERVVQCATFSKAEMPDRAARERGHWFVSRRSRIERTTSRPGTSRSACPGVSFAQGPGMDESISWQNVEAEVECDYRVGERTYGDVVNAGPSNRTGVVQCHSAAGLGAHSW